MVEYQEIVGGVLGVGFLIGLPYCIWREGAYERSVKRRLKR